MSNITVELLVGLSPVGVVIISFLTWIVSKLSKHEVALALLIQQVNPPGDKSLRELLHDIQIEQARTGKKQEE